MRVLIIGAKGMLGGELVRVFSDGHEVLAWDREEIDITRHDEAGQKVTAAAPDLIINAAAYNAVDKAEEEPAVADAINGHAAGALADVAEVLGIPLVHFSTDYVFDGNQKEGYREGDPPNPLSIYAKSKLMGERLLAAATDEYWLVRTSRLFGKAGAAPGAKKPFPDLMLELARTKKIFDLVDDERSSPTYTVDLAARVREIVEKEKPFGIYHATGSGSCTWFEYGKKVFEFAGVSVECRPVRASAFLRPAVRPSSSVLISTKLPPMRSWEDALKEYMRV